MIVVQGMISVSVVLEPLTYLTSSNAANCCIVSLYSLFYLYSTLALEFIIIIFFTVYENDKSRATCK